MSDQDTQLPTENSIPSTPPQASDSDPSWDDPSAGIDWGELVGIDAAEPAPAEPAPAPAPAPEPAAQVAPQPVPAPAPAAPAPDPNAPAVVVPLHAPTPQPQPPAQPAQPVQAPVAAEPLVQPQPQELPPQPAPQQPAPAPTAQPVQTAAEAAQAYAQQREQWLSTLEQAYTPTQEDIELLQNEPEKALPKALAQVHVRAAEETSQYVLGQVHQMVGAAVKQQLEMVRNEAQFYRAWPQLRNPAYAQTVSTVGYAFRQMNPQATPEQFIQQVGAQASVALGLPIGQTQPAARPTPAPSPQAIQQQFRTAAPSYQPAMPGVAAPAGATPELQGVEKDLAELWQDFEANGWG